MTRRLERELLEQMYQRYNFRCFIDPSKRADQRAHIIGNTKLNRRIYGRDIIDNPLNWLPVCGLANNALVDVGKNWGLAGDIKWLILAGDREGIEELVRENIERKRGKV